MSTPPQPTSDHPIPIRAHHLLCAVCVRGGCDSPPCGREALRPVLLPGDGLHIAITKEGKEAGQGVGYLGDGTMVVVAEAASSVGTEIDAEVTSVLQTSAGRMVFARLREVS